MDIDNVNINNLSDAEIVCRMRKCNYEKYKTLVRMHLSFELELNTDEFDLPCHEIVYEDRGKVKKWSRLSKKQRHLSGSGCASNGKSSSSAENSPTETLNQQIDPGFMFHLNELKSFLLLSKNITQEGIFRKTGSISRQNELRVHIQSERPLKLQNGDYTPHDCATVFKGYLADMQEPLLTDAHYPAHLQIAPLCSDISPSTSSTSQKSDFKREHHLLNSVQLLLLLLPEDNRQLMEHVIEILHNVIQHQSSNKMSADNLATLFTPHLICPRNLPPEALHYLCKKMSGIIAYMITKGAIIFEVPAKLATDIRAYFLERKRKKTMSPEQTLDESISDISTVNTVYTFVDREKTAAAHTTNTTDTELAQLYAHIQSLPESSKKRRLIKQFNKQNGQGTPLQLVVMNRLKNSEASRGAKSISDSIKKHIFHRTLMSRTPKRANAQLPVGVETPNFSNDKNPKLRVLFQSPVSEENKKVIVEKSSSSVSSSQSASNSHKTIKSHQLQKCVSSFVLSSTEILQPQCINSELSSTYSNEVLNLHGSNRRSISAPVSRQSSAEGGSDFSASDSGKFELEECQIRQPSPLETPTNRTSETTEQFSFQETEKKKLAWHSEKIVDVERASKIEQNCSDLKSRFKSEPNLSRIITEKVRESADNTDNDLHVLSKGGKSLTRKLMKGVSMNNIKLPFTTPESTKRIVRSVSSTFKRQTNDEMHTTGHHRHAHNLYTNSASTVPLLEDIDDEDFDDETFEDSPDDQLDSYSSTENQEIPGRGSSNSSSYSHDLASCSNSPRQYLLLQHSIAYRKLDLITSTPSLLLGRRRSMSPITKSTQRMPRAMQESIMTPRSRKPVMDITLALSGSDQNQTICQTDMSGFREQHEEASNERKVQKELPKTISDRKFTEISDCTKLKDKQTIHGSSKKECALSSDFKEYLLSRSVRTASPVDSSFSSQPDDFNSTQDIEQINQSQLSKSLLYCLDGNEPDDLVNDSENTTPAKYFPMTYSMENIESIQDAGITINNARKRAASHTLEKGEKTLLTDEEFFENKENHEHINSYLLTKKLLINEHPGETSF